MTEDMKMMLDFIAKDDFEYQLFNKSESYMLLGLLQKREHKRDQQIRKEKLEKLNNSINDKNYNKS